MSEPIGQYHFYPWIRRGIGAALKGPDPDPLPDRAMLSVQLTVNVTLAGAVTAKQPDAAKVNVYGPGDVAGINPNVVVRTEPKPYTQNFEPNYLAGIELDSPDLPWLFTPGAPVGDRLQPWLALIVLKSGSAEFSESKPQTRPLPSITASVAPLQDLKDSWCWAHVQVSDPRPIVDLLANDPGHVISRILCPRRLDPETTYDAFLVPAFDIGCQAGLGKDVSGIRTSTPAWSKDPNAPQSVQLPYYYRFSFRTSDAGDFESLVRRLKPQKDLPALVGMRPMVVDQPGPHIPGAGPALGLEGALIRVGTQPTEWDDPAKTNFQTKVQDFVNLGTSTADDPANPNADDPRVVPPIYGRWHAGVATVDRTHAGWLNELNLDPRHRTAGGMGTQVVQINRTSFLASAWRQVGDVIKANQLLRQAQLARAAMLQLFRQHFVAASQTTLMRLTAPVYARMRASPRTVLAEIRASRVPERMLSGTFRRLTRPLGALRRRQGAPPSSYDALLTRLNDGGLMVVPLSKPPDGMVSVEGISDSLAGPLKGPSPWQRLLLILFLLLLLLLLALAAFALGGVIVAAAVVAALVVAASLLPQVQQLFSGAPASDTVRFSNVTPDVIAAIPPRPDFQVTEPGQPPASAGGAGGTTDSPDAQAFREATSKWAGLIALAQPAEAERPPLAISQLASTILTRLDPMTTVPARALAQIPYLGLTWTPADPIEPIMAAPDFPQPMYKPLKELSEQYVLPGAELIPHDSISLLQANHAFIEAYMVGLNHEMARQLLWNAYPTDQRGSYFRQFWDVGAYVPQPGDPTDPKALTELLKDIPPIHTWPKAPGLGHHENRTDIVENNLVLIVRGELLKRYPNTIVFAGKAVMGADGKRKLDESPGAEAFYKNPIFGGKLEPDMTFFGFNLTAEEARGSADAPHGYFFGFQQIPTEPRFGLEPLPDKAPVDRWASLSWQNFAANNAMSSLQLSYRSLPLLANSWSPRRLASSVFRLSRDSATLPDFVPATTQPHHVAITADPTSIDAPDHAIQWGQDSAQSAYVLLRLPFRIMVHADRMLPPP
jgi:hypothetical protein